MMNNISIREEAVMVKPLLPDSARQHKDEDFLKAKLDRLWDPHVAPLNELCDQMAGDTGKKIPYFDPFDGGVNAKLLFILYKPQNGAEGSNIVSMDNDDPAAETTFHAFGEAGIPRSDIALWNIIPWFDGTDDYSKGKQLLKLVLPLIPDVKTLVFAGKGMRQKIKSIRLRCPSGPRCCLQLVNP